MRFDVIAAAEVPGGAPVIVSSHEVAPQAAEAAKKEAIARGVIVEVVDNDLKKAIFRARGAEWRWITR